MAASPSEPLPTAEVQGPAISFALNDGTTYALSRAFVARVGGALAALAREAVYGGNDPPAEMDALPHGLGASLALDAEMFRQWARWEQGFIAPHVLTPQSCFEIDAMAKLLQVPPRATTAFTAHARQVQTTESQLGTDVGDCSHTVRRQQITIDNARAVAALKAQRALAEETRCALQMQEAMRSIPEHFAPKQICYVIDLAVQQMTRRDVEGSRARAFVRRLKREHNHEVLPPVDSHSGRRRDTLSECLQRVCPKDFIWDLLEFVSNEMMTITTSWRLHVKNRLFARLAVEDAQDAMMCAGMEELDRARGGDASCVDATTGSGAGAGADGGAEEAEEVGSI